MVRKSATRTRSHSASRSVLKASMASRSGRSSRSAPLSNAGPSYPEIAFSVRLTRGSTVCRQKTRLASCIIRVSIVARNAEQHSQRDAEGQRDFARGGVFGVDEVHVSRCHRHGFPVEPAFEQHGTARIERALIILVEFLACSR